MGIVVYSIEYIEMYMYIRRRLFYYGKCNIKIDIFNRIKILEILCVLFIIVFRNKKSKGNINLF